MNLIISKELAQAIANYLQERPFKEVAVLLQEMAKLKPAVQEANLKAVETGDKK